MNKGVCAVFVLSTLIAACGSEDPSFDGDITVEDVPVQTTDLGSVRPSAHYWRRTGTWQVPSTDVPTETAPNRTSPGALAGLHGVNVAGGEFGTNLPGAFGTDYTFPTHSEIDYYVAKGMNVFRVGFRWERLQRAAYGALDATYAARIDDVVSYVTARGARVILNPHNFARYYGSTVGSSQVPNGVFADLWKRLSAKYVSNPRVMFNLVNEPNALPTEQWVGAANAAITSIRSTGSTNVIVVPGNGWTGGWTWYSNGYGTPNAVALLDVHDPADNLVFEAHQYLDSDASGGSADCVSTTAGRERLAPFIKWLRDNHKRGIVGEFAGGNNATCNAAVTDMIHTMNDASDVIVGWLWWAGGPWWGDYQFTLDPKGGVDRPQMALLAPFLAK